MAAPPANCAPGCKPSARRNERRHGVIGDWLPAAGRRCRALGRVLLLVLGIGVGPGLSVPAAAAALDVLAGPRQVAVSASDWCATPRELSLEAVRGGACTLQPLTPAERARGFDQRAFWVRLHLANPGPEPVERWIEVGHPRLGEVSLFVATPAGWERRDLGLAIPLVARGAVEREAGVLPVSLAARSERMVWLRVASDTPIDLTPRVWDPAVYRQSRSTLDFWSAMGLGGLTVALLFALLMLALTREATYGFFALAMLGSLITVGIITGLLQRHAWPSTWPLPSAMIALGALLSLLGYYGMLRAFIPQLARYRRTLGLLKGLVGLTVGLLLFAVGIDFAAVAWLWSQVIILTGMTMLGVIWLAWRGGDRAAGILLVAFAMPMVLLGVRLLFSLGLIDWAPELVLLGPWAMVLSTPVVLLGLVDRTRQLQGELLRVQAESAAQLAFLARMSHELRSPLDTILGYAQLLARTHPDLATSAGVLTIRDSGRHLLRMIDHLLDYARGAAGMLELQPEPVRLATFLRGIERMARQLAAHQDNRFELITAGGTAGLAAGAVRLDADRLRQVLGNLLANAARHTQHGAIRLEVQAQPLGAGRLRLEFAVSDTGEGIAPEDQARVFQPFERAQRGVAKRRQGAGLGLAIARQIVERMGGDLTLESVLGAGACFRFWLPVQVLPAEAVTRGDQVEGFTAAGYAGPRRCVLLVDDEGGSRGILAGLLQELGFAVLEAESGNAVAARLPGLPALDLVLTDQFMPDGDGWQVLEVITAARPEVPVVLLSAAPPSPPADWPGDCRFAAQFLKPIDHALLLRRIGDLLDLQWLDDPLPSAGPSAPADFLSPEPTLPNAGSADLTTASSVTAVTGAAVDAGIGPSGLQRGYPSAARVAPMPADLLHLARLVELGQVTAIKEWALDLKSRHPEQAAFADQMLTALNGLDFDRLAQLAKSGAS